MSNVVIKVEDLSKQYRLGQVGRKTLHDDVNRWLHKIVGKENPYLKIGEENDRTKKGNTEYVWALKEINFEVKQGEVLGIVGRNGAGKSTLLKILSKVTAPTKGKIKIKGKIASLLEVGTGFHPDLSGRDNIFLNGAILGMTKKEIKNKFDEIVDFAGIERYIDTPVKRYSSGMYVRLAFAVAAHLEPDILIVDEVLAVGDAEFQKKCLGKMKDVSVKEGRTVLFVSHNMDAISRLCDSAFVLSKGKIIFCGSGENSIAYYLNGDKNILSYRKWLPDEIKPGNSYVQLEEVSVKNTEGNICDNFLATERIEINFVYKILKDDFNYTHGFNLYKNGIHILSSHDIKNSRIKNSGNMGIYSASVFIPSNFLTEGLHTISVAIMSYNPYIVHFHEMEAVSFIVTDSLNDETSARGGYGGNFPGIIRPILEWKNMNYDKA
ncbi:MAG: ABC transporter ATP-binding protein [Chitinophagaceae bacterium]